MLCRLVLAVISVKSGMTKMIDWMCRRPLDLVCTKSTCFKSEETEKVTTIARWRSTLLPYLRFEYFSETHLPRH
jgi:hypothetical protein